MNTDVLKFQHQLFTNGYMIKIPVAFICFHTTIL